MLTRSMKLDALVGIAITVCAGGAGLASGITNPFNIGVAQGLVGLPLFSAMWIRILAFIGFNASVNGRNYAADSVRSRFAVNRSYC